MGKRRSVGKRRGLGGRKNEKSGRKSGRRREKGGEKGRNGKETAVKTQERQAIEGWRKKGGLKRAKGESKKGVGAIPEKEWTDGAAPPAVPRGASALQLFHVKRQKRAKRASAPLFCENREGAKSRQGRANATASQGGKQVEPFRYSSKGLALYSCFT